MPTDTTLVFAAVLAFVIALIAPTLTGVWAIVTAKHIATEVARTSLETAKEAAKAAKEVAVVATTLKETGTLTDAKLDKLHEVVNLKLDVATYELKRFREEVASLRDKD